MARSKTLVALVAGLSVFLAAGSALATNFGGPRDSGKHCNEDPVVSQCLADSSYHTV